MKKYLGVVTKKGFNHFKEKELNEQEKREATEALT
jgi:hypothetical protein